MLDVLIVHIPYQVRGGEDVHVEQLLEVYRRRGLKVGIYPKDRSAPQKLFVPGVQSLLTSSATLELRKLVEESRPKFIHLHNIFPNLGPQLLVWLAQAKIPTVMTIHNHRYYCANGLALRNETICKKCRDGHLYWRPLVNNCNKSWSRSGYYSLAMSRIRMGDLYLKAVSKFIAPSPYIKEEMVRAGVPAERITQLFNPVLDDNSDWTRFPPDSDVMYAGRLSVEKGIRPLLKAIHLLPDLRFVIAGDGPLRHEVQQAARQCPQLSYVGSLNRDDLMAKMARTRLGVLPSICNEILPTFTLECFGFGLHCIIPRLESTNWLGSSPLPGILADTQDPQDIARAIREGLKQGAPDSETLLKIRSLFGVQRYADQLMSTLEPFLVGPNN